MIQNLPSQTKVVAEAATVASVGGATALGIIPAIMGTLASAAGFIWICIQMYFFLKDRRAKKNEHSAQPTDRQ